MFSTQYLFGIDPEELENKFYFEALQYKKEKGTRHYRKLFLKHDKTKEELDQMFWIEKALTHTEKLLNERVA